MPWDKKLDKNKFMAPDFSSIDVLTFAGDRLPAGINLPNYYDVRDEDGFKNVVFKNKEEEKAAKMKVFNYRLAHVKDKHQSDLINRNQARAYQVMVAGHELFGHGSGKLIYRNEKTGQCPVSAEAPVNPGKVINSCYEKGETYSSRFGNIGTSFEECRADLSGLWLEHFPEMYSLFGWTEEDKSTLQWSSMMQSARKGILGLESSYNEEKKRWNQAHTQGAYVISQYIMQNQKSDILSIKFKKNARGKDDFYIEINKDNLLKEGHELIGKLLSSFQVWKSLGAVEEAREFYAKYSQVGEREMKIKAILNSVPKQQGIRLF